MGLIASSSSSSGGGAVAFFFILAVVWTVLIFAGWWKIFTKAGRPGWAALIPIYNAYTLCKVVGRPGWWVVLLMIPFVNIIALIVLMLDLAKSFGKGVGFAVGLVIFGPIFSLILGFGSARYLGPVALTGQPSVSPG